MEKNLDQLIYALIENPTETEWLEFKKDNADPKVIGEDISALANGAALIQRDFAYMVWGVDDKTHQIVGTTFSPYKKAKGNQELTSWLIGMLSDNALFEFQSAVIDGKTVVVLIISAARQYPVAFQNDAFIRAGSNTKRLAKELSLQSRLWDCLRNERFETAVALKDLTGDEVEEKLDVAAYFNGVGQKVPESQMERLKYLESECIIRQQDNKRFSITNFGAVLLARNLRDFPSVSRKEIRVVQYAGDSRGATMERSISFEQGYAVCATHLVEYVDALLPSREPIASTGLREVHRTYPPSAVRELLINAMIHQDLTSTGNCVTCEIFSDRVEITNPGELLIEKERIVDLPPISRNALLARVMRRMRLCEELGTGWDKVAESCEQMQLPAPTINQQEHAVKSVLYSGVDFFELSREQKLWACYLHACVRKMREKSVTNATLRDRFGLDQENSASISRLLGDAVRAGLLKVKGEGGGRRSKQYLPYWA